MPHGNGANFVSDQPDTSYYRISGRRSAEGSNPSTPGERGYGGNRGYGEYRSQSQGEYGAQEPRGYRSQAPRDPQTPRDPQPPRDRQAPRTPQTPQDRQAPRGYQAPQSGDGYPNPYGDPTRGNQYARGQRPTPDARGGRPRERGLPGWLAVVVLIVIAGASGLIDSLSGSAIRGVFNYGLVVASLVAILVVRRSQMFPVVVSPPLVYFAASGALLYIRSGGLHDRVKLIDVATNWIVYGFPAIAGATAVVLVIAGLRLVTRR